MLSCNKPTSGQRTKWNQVRVEGTRDFAKNAVLANEGSYFCHQQNMEHESSTRLN